ncbi:hypothetical protein B0H17DRAFT_1139329 [Mycena rosella]|uniref:Uncharacterized protein n=1 Tax=Mycena rosella TaxID=1033263 RepID=A0AAD7D4H2_MYCRO|nr:hypothetical protein B0H17DRAFT_1139329 [Mycena rosella]
MSSGGVEPPAFPRVPAAVVYLEGTSISAPRRLSWLILVAGWAHNHCLRIWVEVVEVPVDSKKRKKPFEKCLRVESNHQYSHMYMPVASVCYVEGMSVLAPRRLSSLFGLLDGWEGEDKATDRESTYGLRKKKPISFVQCLRVESNHRLSDVYIFAMTSQLVCAAGWVHNYFSFQNSASANHKAFMQQIREGFQARKKKDGLREVSSGGVEPPAFPYVPA